MRNRAFKGVHSIVVNVMPSFNISSNKQIPIFSEVLVFTIYLESPIPSSSINHRLVSQQHIARVFGSPKS